MATRRDTPNVGAVRHFVSFRFKQEVTEQQKQEIRTRYTSLNQKSIHPVTKQPYIVSFEGGFPNSHEGKDKKMDQGYIVTFASVEDRDFFVGKTDANPHFHPFDTHHDEFKTLVGPLLDDVFVFDFIVL